MLRAQQPVGRGLSGRHGGTEAVPWGSPSLHVVPESRNVCWQGVLGTRLTPLRVAAYQVQPSTLRLPLTWPSEGPSPLLRGTPWVPCAGSILGLSGPGKPPVESGVNEADSPKAKRRLVRGRLVGAWRAAGLRGPGTGKPQCALESHSAWGVFFRVTQRAVWPRNSSTRTSGAPRPVRSPHRRGVAQGHTVAQPGQGSGPATLRPDGSRSWGVGGTNPGLPERGRETPLCMPSGGSGKARTAPRPALVSELQRHKPPSRLQRREG